MDRENPIVILVNLWCISNVSSNNNKHRRHNKNNKHKEKRGGVAINLYHFSSWDVYEHVYSAHTHTQAHTHNTKCIFYSQWARASSLYGVDGKCATLRERETYIHLCHVYAQGPNQPSSSALHLLFAESQACYTIQLQASLLALRMWKFVVLFFAVATKSHTWILSNQSFVSELK